jgi:type IV fimbrial biogenesis protein FimT
MLIRDRRGFTLYELFVAILIMGLVLAFSYPRISRFARAGSLRTSRSSMITAVNVAKSAAVASGRCGYLRMTSSAVTVFTVNCQGSGTQIEIVSNRNFTNDYGVSLAMTKGGSAVTLPDSVGFDPRGIPMNNTQTVTFTMSRSGESRTVTVGTYGRVQ